MTNYDAGRRFEWATRDDLESHGYWVARAAGSKGKADLIAIKPGQVLFVQCKRDGKCSPAERAEVRRIAALLPTVALPILAHRLTGPVRVAYALLTGDGPRDREPWTPDLIGDQP